MVLDELALKCPPGAVIWQFRARRATI